MFHSFVFPTIGLPLLARELTEMANRPRTYWLRGAYAVLLFVVAYASFYETLRPGRDMFAVLGQGRRMFETLVGLQFAGIYLFMPIVGCSAITSEKERNTLGLLFLTKLGPTTILFEKLLSRLVPMFVFLLLSMPLLAFTYSLGGVTEFQLWGTVVVVALTAVQVASLTLMCSAYCATTISAFVASYALSLASLFFCSCCGLAFVFTGAGGVTVAGPADFGVRLIILSISTAFFLALARDYLVSRAFVTPSGLLADSLNRLDRVSVKRDASTGGVVLVRQTHSLPADAPVAWRETARSLAGSMDSGFLVLIAIELPLLLLLIVALSHGAYVPMVAGIEILLWVVTALLLAVTTSGLISRERERQTLEALLITPLTGREILTQKLQPVWRLVLVLWIPFGSIMLFRLLAWAINGFAHRDGVFLLTSVATVLLYMPLIVWFSLLVSLLVKWQGRAIFSTLVLIGAWTFLPLLVMQPFHFRMLYPWQQLMWLLLSTAAIFQVGAPAIAFPVMAVLIHALVYGTLLAAIRYYVLTRADVLLGRPGDRETASVGEV